MPIEGFDYKNFTKRMKLQARELIPTEINDENQSYILDKIEQNAIMAGKVLIEDKNFNYTQEQYELIIQLVTEWTFHKSIDLINGGNHQEYIDSALQEIALSVLEIAKKGIYKQKSKNQILIAVEHYIKDVSISYSNHDSFLSKSLLPLVSFITLALRCIMNRELPSFNKYIYSRAWFLFDFYKNYEQAILEFKKIIGKKYFEGNPEYYIARCYELLNEKDKAEEYYKKAIAINKNCAVAIVNHYLAIHNIRKAKDYYQFYIDNNKDELK